jgi:dipeptidyl aminopeptidase/acylaminoacyl peptidase
MPYPILGVARLDPPGRRRGHAHNVCYWRVRGALLVLLLSGSAANIANARPLTAVDLITMPRVGDPHVAPDGRTVLYTVGVPNIETNKIDTSVWLASIDGPEATRRLAVSDKGASSPRWSSDGRAIYFKSNRSGSNQIWMTDSTGETATQVTRLPLDVDAFKVSPDGHRIIVSLAVFPDCESVNCTTERNAADKKKSGDGRIYDRLYVRQVQQWTTGTRQHLFALALDARGVADGDPTALTSRFSGDAGAVTVTADGRTVYFQSTPADAREPWNLPHIWRTSTDGSTAPADL